MLNAFRYDPFDVKSVDHLVNTAMLHITAQSDLFLLVYV